MSAACSPTRPCADDTATALNAAPPPPLAAELRWDVGEKPNFYTGWLFSKIDADTLKLIDNYIADHPQDLIKDLT